MNTNPILNVDSYKTSHFLQYPPGAEIVSSYIESRGGEYAESVFFGLQMFLKQYLTKPITKADIEEADEVLTAHGVPFNRSGWEYILEKHGGYLPLEIEALPEGTITSAGVPLVQIKNTSPDAFWLPTYIETALLRAVWFRCHVRWAFLRFRLRVVCCCPALIRCFAIRVWLFLKKWRDRRTTTLRLNRLFRLVWCGCCV